MLPNRSSGATNRLMGIDVARGLAVLGMFVVHVGMGWTLADGSNALYPVTAGRAAGLFALLAGVSIALLSGGSQPPTGQTMGVALWRIVVRGLLMLPVGMLLTLLDTPVSVILAYYAIFFVLAVPLLQERWKVVATAAVVLGVLGPVVSFYLRAMITEDTTFSAGVALINAVDPLEVYVGEGLVDLVLTGAYPAITWLPFVLAGLAVGRLNLGSRRVQVWLIALGAAIATLAYTASWVALWRLGGAERLAASTDPASGQNFGQSGLAEALYVGFPGVELPTSDWAWLLVVAPHSGTPFEVFGVIGVGLAVLGSCLLVAPYLQWVLYPLASVGALALTVYVGHVLLMYVDEQGWLAGTRLAVVTDNLAWSVVGGSLLLASVWRLVARRGPLEGPLYVVSSWVARRIP